MLARQEVNPYVYGLANPVLHTDPSGLIPCEGISGNHCNFGNTDPYPIWLRHTERPEDDSYALRSWQTFILGNYHDDPTLAGVALQVLTGLAGVDLPGDVRDLVYDCQHWEWTWGHAAQTGLDTAAFLPLIGGLKYLGKFGGLAKFADDLPPGGSIRQHIQITESRAPVSSQLWLLDAKQRGTRIDKMFGANTGLGDTRGGFRAYDVWDPNSKTAISLKSINLNSPGYISTPSDINRNLSSGLHDIRQFSSDRLPDGTTLLNIEILNREMIVFIPPGKGDIYERQLGVLERFIMKAAQLTDENGNPIPVTVSIATIP